MTSVRLVRSCHACQICFKPSNVINAFSSVDTRVEAVSNLVTLVKDLFKSCNVCRDLSSLVTRVKFYSGLITLVNYWHGVFLVYFGR